MSEVEHVTGVLVKLDRGDLSLSEFAHNIICKLGLDTDKHYDPTDPLEGLMDLCYEQYIQYGGEIYQIIDRADPDPYDDIYDCKKMPGSKNKFTFNVRYYDGGCCLTEALGKALDKLDKK